MAGALMLAPGVAVQAQSTPGQAEGPLTENPRQSRSQSDGGTPANSAPPRSDADRKQDRSHDPTSDRTQDRSAGPTQEQSSSELDRMDLSPPKADELAHPDGGHAADDALGTHEWNPLRAMKDVEVGTYYYKAGNYKAAVSRFREALQFKPRDAEATFKLAQALEKSGDFAEARVHYEAYLTILKDGPSTGEARKALERMKKH